MFQWEKFRFIINVNEAFYYFLLGGIQIKF